MTDVDGGESRKFSSLGMNVASGLVQGGLWTGVLGLVLLELAPERTDDTLPWWATAILVAVFVGHLVLSLRSSVRVQGHLVYVRNPVRRWVFRRDEVVDISSRQVTPARAYVVFRVKRDGRTRRIPAVTLPTDRVGMLDLPLLPSLRFDDRLD